MTDKQEVIRSFREARIVGEELLSQGKITWEQFQFTMVGYELKGAWGKTYEFLF